MNRGIKLSNGLTPEDEQYAALLAEGGAQSTAYRKVWPPSENTSIDDIYSMASRKAIKVRSRVQELVDLAAGNTVVTIETLTREINTDRAFAYDKGNAGAAIQATKLKAQIHKHLSTGPSTEGLLGEIVNLLAGLDKAALAKPIDGQAVEIHDETAPERE